MNWDWHRLLLRMRKLDHVALHTIGHALDLDGRPPQPREREHVTRELEAGGVGDDLHHPDDPFHFFDFVGYAQGEETVQWRLGEFFFALE